MPWRDGVEWPEQPPPGWEGEWPPELSPVSPASPDYLANVAVAQYLAETGELVEPWQLGYGASPARPVSGPAVPRPELKSDPFDWRSAALAGAGASGPMLPMGADTDFQYPLGYIGYGSFYTAGEAWADSAANIPNYTGTEWENPFAVANRARRSWQAQAEIERQLPVLEQDPAFTAGTFVGPAVKGFVGALSRDVQRVPLLGDVIWGGRVAATGGLQLLGSVDNLVAVEPWVAGNSLAEVTRNAWTAATQVGSGADPLALRPFESGEQEPGFVGAAWWPRFSELNREARALRDPATWAARYGPLTEQQRAELGMTGMMAYGTRPFWTIPFQSPDEQETVAGNYADYAGWVTGRDEMAAAALAAGARLMGPVAQPSAVGGLQERAESALAFQGVQSAAREADRIAHMSAPDWQQSQLSVANQMAFGFLFDWGNALEWASRGLKLADMRTAEAARRWGAGVAEGVVLGPRLPLPGESVLAAGLEAFNAVPGRSVASQFADAGLGGMARAPLGSLPADRPLPPGYAAALAAAGQQPAVGATYAYSWLDDWNPLGASRLQRQRRAVNELSQQVLTPLAGTLWQPAGLAGAESGLGILANKWEHAPQEMLEGVSNFEFANAGVVPHSSFDRFWELSPELRKALVEWDENPLRLTGGRWDIAPEQARLLETWQAVLSGAPVDRVVESLGYDTWIPQPGYWQTPGAAGPAPLVRQSEAWFGLTEAQVFEFAAQGKAENLEAWRALLGPAMEKYGLAPVLGLQGLDAAMPFGLDWGRAYYAPGLVGGKRAVELRQTFAGALSEQQMRASGPQLQSGAVGASDALQNSLSAAAGRYFGTEGQARLDLPGWLITKPALKLAEAARWATHDAAGGYRPWVQGVAAWTASNVAADAGRIYDAAARRGLVTQAELQEAWSQNPLELLFPGVGSKYRVLEVSNVDEFDEATPWTTVGDYWLNRTMWTQPGGEKGVLTLEAVLAGRALTATQGMELSGMPRVVNWSGSGFRSFLEGERDAAGGIVQQYLDWYRRRPEVQALSLPSDEVLLADPDVWDPLFLEEFLKASPDAFDEVAAFGVELWRSGEFQNSTVGWPLYSLALDQPEVALGRGSADARWVKFGIFGNERVAAEVLGLRAAEYRTLGHVLSGEPYLWRGFETAPGMGVTEAGELRLNYFVQDNRWGAGQGGLSTTPFPEHSTYFSGMFDESWAHSVGHTKYSRQLVPESGLMVQFPVPLADDVPMSYIFRNEHEWVPQGPLGTGLPLPVQGTTFYVTADAVDRLASAHEGLYGAVQRPYAKMPLEMILDRATKVAGKVGEPANQLALASSYRLWAELRRRYTAAALPFAGLPASVDLSAAGSELRQLEEALTANPQLREWFEKGGLDVGPKQLRPVTGEMSFEDWSDSFDWDEANEVLWPYEDTGQFVAETSRGPLPPPVPGVADAGGWAFRSSVLPWVQVKGGPRSWDVLGLAGRAPGDVGLFLGTGARNYVEAAAAARAYEGVRGAAEALPVAFEVLSRLPQTARRAVAEAQLIWNPGWGVQNALNAFGSAAWDRSLTTRSQAEVAAAVARFGGESAAWMSSATVSGITGLPMDRTLFRQLGDDVTSILYPMLYGPAGGAEKLAERGLSHDPGGPLGRASQALGGAWFGETAIPLPGGGALGWGERSNRLRTYVAGTEAALGAYLPKMATELRGRLAAEGLAADEAGRLADAVLADLVGGSLQPETEKLLAAASARRPRVGEYVRSVVVPQMQSVMAAATDAGSRQSEFTMLDPGMTVNAQEWLQPLFMYGFFRSQTALNWTQRFVERPGLTVDLARWRNGVARENQRSEVPVSQEGTLPLAGGWRVPDPMGVLVPLQALVGRSVYRDADTMAGSVLETALASGYTLDPTLRALLEFAEGDGGLLQTFVPQARLLDVFGRKMKGDEVAARAAARRLAEWVQAGKLTQDEAYRVLAAGGEWMEGERYAAGDHALDVWMGLYHGIGAERDVGTATSLATGVRASYLSPGAEQLRYAQEAFFSLHRSKQDAWKEVNPGLEVLWMGNRLFGEGVDRENVLEELDHKLAAGLPPMPWLGAEASERAHPGSASVPGSPFPAIGGTGYLRESPAEVQRRMLAANGAPYDAEDALYPSGLWSDLAALPHIGALGAERLRGVGIYSFAQLAAADARVVAAVTGLARDETAELTAAAEERAQAQGGQGRAVSVPLPGVYAPAGLITPPVPAEGPAPQGWVQPEGGEPRYLYALRGPDGGVAYVGQTNNPEQRYVQHVRDVWEDPLHPKSEWERALLQQGDYPTMQVFWEDDGVYIDPLEMAWIGYFEYGQGLDMTNLDTPTKEEWRRLMVEQGLTPAKMAEQFAAWSAAPLRTVTYETLGAEGFGAAVAGPGYARAGAPADLTVLPGVGAARAARLAAAGGDSFYYVALMGAAAVAEAAGVSRAQAEEIVAVAQQLADQVGRVPWVAPGVEHAGVAALGFAPAVGAGVAPGALSFFPPPADAAAGSVSGAGVVPGALSFFPPPVDAAAGGVQAGGLGAAGQGAQDALDLLEALPGVGGATAERLLRAGYGSPWEIAAAGVEELAGVSWQTGSGSHKLGKAKARELLQATRGLAAQGLLGAAPADMEGPWPSIWPDSAGRGVAPAVALPAQPRAGFGPSAWSLGGQGQLAAAGLDALEALPFIGEATARRLWGAGYESVGELAGAQVGELAGVSWVTAGGQKRRLGEGTARQIILAARARRNVYGLAGAANAAWPFGVAGSAPASASTAAGGSEGAGGSVRPAAGGAAAAPALDPTDLTVLTGVGPAKAALLRAAGYLTLQDVANADPGDLEAIKGISADGALAMVGEAAQLVGLAGGGFGALGARARGLAWAAVSSDAWLLRQGAAGSERVSARGRDVPEDLYVGPEAALVSKDLLVSFDEQGRRLDAFGHLVYDENGNEVRVNRRDLWMLKRAAAQVEALDVGDAGRVLDERAEGADARAARVHDEYEERLRRLRAMYAGLGDALDRQ